MANLNTTDMIRKDVHIEILKYAYEHGEFLCQDLMNDLEFNQNEKDYFSQILIHEGNLICNTGRNKTNDDGQHSIFTISTEGRFKLLEYDELQEARKSSQGARFWSIVAMIITALFSFFSICIQLFRPIQIDDAQITGLIKEINTK